ncbi:MAG: PLP-dependent cysteine synthase family protein [Synergistaceae bacterium]|jgi:cysteine synthase B|nr:PLP-dependent cysteine synthase family protein [Synergistaceae bacterium]
MLILDLIGNTPLIDLPNISAEVPGVRLAAKAEFFNPSGSVKDRAAKAMIEGGIKSGELSPGRTIIDATSGNTGIAYAMIGAALHWPVKLYMPQNASSERKRIIRSYGSEIIETSPLEGSDGAFLAAKDEVESHPELYFYPDQYNNPENPKAHYETTGVEIWNQSEEKITHFITGMGTSGTFMGVSRRLRDFSETIKILAVQPSSPFHGIEGTKHMGSTIKPGIYDENASDDVVEVTTEEAYEMTRRLAREEGIFAGVSSGANVSAALALARTLPEGSFVVTVLCDQGTRYLSDEFWGEL